MKILVVDDEKVLVKGIKFNLESEGYQVEAGYDGEEAVELARNGSFDLIILDLMMPKIDGLQACMRIREFSNVPIIMLTARSEDTDKIIGFECGADDYITKPFNILELKARVRALLRRAGMAAQKQGAAVAVHGPHHPGCGRPGRLEGRQERGSHRQGVRPDGAAAAQPGPGVFPGEPAQRGVGL
ncbi:response regulator [Flavonifractor plautii]|nr:response regulator [Flavonifractor plautii]